MGKLAFLIKSKYNKAINKLMSASDKIEYSIYQIDQNIIKLGDALTKFEVLNESEERDATIENIKSKIIELHNKKVQISEKKQDFVAKIKYLEAMKEANLAFSKVGCLSGNDIDGIVSGIESEIKTLEAELSTQSFLNSLK